MKWGPEVREFFERVSEETDLVIYLKDVEGRYLYVNPAFEAVSTIPRDRILGRKDEELFPPAVARTFKAQDAETIRRRGTVEFEETLELPTGVRSFVTQKLPLIDGKGKVRAVGGFCAEVTAHVEAGEQARARSRESERLYRQLFEYAGDYVLVLHTPPGGVPRIVDCNRAAAAKHGYSRKELVGKPVSMIDPAPRKELIERVKLAAIGDIFEATHRRKDGSTFIAECVVRVMDIGGKPHQVSIERDVTERKRAEEALRAAQRQRLEALGVMAGGIAHDFNNLLVGIEGNLSLLAAGLEGDRKTESLLRDIETACQKTKSLARQLLTFASGGGPAVRSEDLVPLVRETAVFLTRGSNVRCAFKPMAGPLWAKVDKGQVSQVVQNLVLNAKQAMPRGGTITIGVSAAEVPAGRIPGLDPGPYVRLMVKDEGEGIAPESLARIFDPYYTTKSEGRGLGLAVTRSIVVKHGGHIAVESRPKAGTTFTIHLPAAKGRPQARRKAPAARPGLKGSRILIMDDDADVGRVLKRLVDSLGGKASVTFDGRKALEAYRDAMRAGRPFAAVIADLTVQGGMGGLEMLKRLRSFDAKAKVVVSSGYSNDLVLADSEAHGFQGFLPKPYRLEEVSAALGKALKTA